MSQRNRSVSPDSLARYEQAYALRQQGLSWLEVGEAMGGRSGSVVQHWAQRWAAHLRGVKAREAKEQHGQVADPTGV